jgi:hypothetical protein
MEEYEGAKEAFEAGSELAPDNTFKTWIRKCDAELEGRAGAHRTGGSLWDPSNWRNVMLWGPTTRDTANRQWRYPRSPGRKASTLRFLVAGLALPPFEPTARTRLSLPRLGGPCARRPGQGFHGNSLVGLVL